MVVAATRRPGAAVVSVVRAVIGTGSAPWSQRL